MTTWNCDNFESSSYFYTGCGKESNREIALVEWWLKIIELAHSKTDWNALIADMWIDNTGRIIGHVQNRKDAIGEDKGFRVAITFEHFVDKLDQCEEKNYFSVHTDILAECIDLLQASAMNEKVLRKLRELNVKNPFQIFYAEYGECDF